MAESKPKKAAPAHPPFAAIIKSAIEADGVSAG